MLHYVEKPGSYVSTLINCGIYLFNCDLFEFIKEKLAAKPPQLVDVNAVNSFIANDSIYSRDSVNFEVDIFPKGSEHI